MLGQADHGASADGKLTPELIQPPGDRGDEHRRTAGVAIAEATELGTCYTLDELRDLAEFCRANGLRLFMDGARLANAAAFWAAARRPFRCVDVLSFGGTKNGALGAEASS